MKEAILLLSHGSRRQEANAEWTVIWQMVQQRRPDRLVQGAYIEFAKPSLEEAVMKLVGEGAERIIIVPLFLTVGAHCRSTIPERLDALQQKYEQVSMEMTAHIGAEPLLVDIIEKRIEAVGL